MSSYFPNNPFSSARPILRSKPAFVVGMPVCRANCCLARVMPSARLGEKLRPGM